LEDLFSYLFNQFGSGIIVLINSVSEPIEQSLLVLNVIDELGDVLFLSNRLQHPQHCLVGTAVFGSVQRTGCPGDGCIDIDSG
jgi:hypothetical protein